MGKNKVFIISIMSAFSSMLFSCGDFLDENTEGIIDIDKMIVDNESLEYALIGVYSRLHSIYGTGLIGIGEAGTDITRHSKSNANVSPIDSYTVSPSSTVTENFWYNHYMLIRDANILLQKIEELKVNIPEEEVLRISSEARFLRAFSYFRLMQVYGEVPLVTKMIDEVGMEEFSYPRESIKTIYEFIEGELDDVIKGGGLGEKNGGRVNIWAAKTMLARVYLYVGSSIHRNKVGTPTGAKRSDTGENIEGGVKDMIPGYNEIEESYLDLYSKSNALLKDIIDNGGFDLTNEFYEPFMVSKKNSNIESIWEIQFAEDTEYSSSWSKMFGVRGSGMQNESAVAGTQVFQPVPSFYRYFKDGDLRRNLYITPYNVVKDGDAFKKNNIGGTVTLSIDNLSVAFGCSLDAAYDDIYIGTCKSVDYDTQLGTEKYAWGTSNDRYNWVNEVMPYLSSSECPNNIIVFRYADVLLMYAETEMLLNGASPSDPTTPGYATQNAIDAVNKVVERAMGGFTYDELVASLTETYTLSYESAKSAYESAKSTYDKNPTQNNKITMLKNQVLLEDATLKLNNVGQNTIKPFELNELTYEQLIDERARELCFELYRWFDLQRLGWLKYKVQQRITCFDVITLPEIVEPKHYLYPVPISEIDLSFNPDFKQNPGYTN